MPSLNSIRSAGKKICLGYIYFWLQRSQCRLASSILQVAKSRLGLGILQEIKELSVCDSNLKILLLFSRTAI